MTIQEATERMGVSAHSLRYYERAGLVPPVARAPSGHRRYTDDDLKWVDFVRCLRETGMSIADIRRYMQLAIEGDHTVQARLDLLYEHEKRVAERRRELEAHQKKLAWKIGYYERLLDQPETVA